MAYYITHSKWTVKCICCSSVEYCMKAWVKYQQTKMVCGRAVNFMLYNCRKLYKTIEIMFLKYWYIAGISAWYIAYTCVRTKSAIKFINCIYSLYVCLSSPTKFKEFRLMFPWGLIVYPVIWNTWQTQERRCIYDVNGSCWYNNLWYKNYLIWSQLIIHIRYFVQFSGNQM